MFGFCVSAYMGKITTKKRIFPMNKKFIFPMLAVLALSGCTSVPTVVPTMESSEMAAYIPGLTLKGLDDVRGNMYLPEEVDGLPITWTCDEPDIIHCEAIGDIAPGSVERPTVDTTVMLTASPGCNVSFKGTFYLVRLVDYGAATFPCGKKRENRLVYQRRIHRTGVWQLHLGCILSFGCKRESHNKNNYRDQIFHSLCQKSLNLSDFSIEPTSIPFLEYGKVSIPLVTSAEMSKV